MSKIVEEKRICDRCKKNLPLYPSFKIMRGKPRKIQALAMRHSWGDGYPIDSIRELCPSCKKAFDVFMKGEAVPGCSDELKGWNGTGGQEHE